MPANHSYKNTFHTGRTVIERHQSSESLAIKPAKGLEAVGQGQRKWKVFLYACAWASRGENRWLCRKQWRWEGKKCYTLLTEGVVASLHHPEQETPSHIWSDKGTNFRKSWLSHLPPYWGTPILGNPPWRSQCVQLHLGDKGGSSTAPLTLSDIEVGPHLGNGKRKGFRQVQRLQKTG